MEKRVGSHPAPLETLKIPQSVSQKRGYIDDNDRFLLHQLYLLGYGDENLYHKIQVEIRKSPTFRFDYYFKSRNTDDLKKRAETLVLALEKEGEEKEKEVKKRSRPAPSKG